MAIKQIAVAVMLVWTATVMAAKAPLANPAVVQEVAFDGCHFKLTDPYRGG